jgi:hypothetical protein
MYVRISLKEERLCARKGSYIVLKYVYGTCICNEASKLLRRNACNIQETFLAITITLLHTLQ